MEHKFSHEKALVRGKRPVGQESEELEAEVS